jgi:hypothetical protein
MNGIDKLIFNELSSHRAVLLPEVGALSVVRSTDSGNPINKVVFSSRDVSGSESVVSLMETLGMERAKAVEIYQQWLDNSKTEDGLIINGVGVLKDGEFTADAEFNNLMNPVMNNNVPAQNQPQGSRPSGLPVWAAIVIPIVLVTLGILIYHFIVNGCSFCTDKTTTATEVVIIPENQPADNTAVATDTEGETADTPAETAKPAGPIYYVVGGIFSIEANADKFVKTYKSAYPDVKTEKVPYKNGRTIVALFSSTDKREAERMCNRYAATQYNYDLWVYKAE